MGYMYTGKNSSEQHKNERDVKGSFMGQRKSTYVRGLPTAPAGENFFD